MNTATIEQHQQVLCELLTEFDRICTLHNIPYTLYAGTALGAVRHEGFIPWDDDADVAMLREDYDRFLAVAGNELGSSYFLQAEFSDHWPMAFSKLRKHNTTCLEKYHPKDEQTHQGIYIDIFPVDNTANSPLIRRLQYVSARIVIAKMLYARGYDTNSPLKRLVMALCRPLPLKPLHRFALQRKRADSMLVHTFFGGSHSMKKSVLPRAWFTETQPVRFGEQEFRVSSQYDALLTALYGDYRKIPDEEERRCKVHAILVDTERPYTDYAHYRDGMTFDVLTRSIR